VNTDKEFSLKNNHSPIYDITKFTHLDYPDHLAAIIWFAGCNMRCDYCYNKEIVFAKSGSISQEDALDFLRSRVSLLDGVVLSGGEATAYDLTEFIRAIKELGFEVKLDTNGTHFNNLEKLLSNKLLDYVALDYKAPKEKFLAITHNTRFEDFSKSLDLLIASNIEFEVRTTLHSDLLTPTDINMIIKDLKKRGYTKTYYIQEFLVTETNIGNLKKPTSNFIKKNLDNLLEIVWR
jgi:pyruvate formate lyase activating enzyme